MTTECTPAPGVASRRVFLRRAAVVGAAAYAIPTVQIITMSGMSAASASGVKDKAPTPPKYDEPKDKKPKDDKPEDEKPKYDKPEDEKPKYDKPEDKEPKDDKSEDKKSEDKKSEDKKSEDKKSTK